jgi:predicted Zn finger-like uncharacterized protein
MIISCPACSKKFKVKDNTIPQTGRNVKCTACNNVWFALPPEEPPSIEEAMSSVSEDIKSHIDDLKSITEGGGKNSENESVQAAQEKAGKSSVDKKALLNNLYNENAKSNDANNELSFLTNTKEAITDEKPKKRTEKGKKKKLTSGKKRVKKHRKELIRQVKSATPVQLKLPKRIFIWGASWLALSLSIAYLAMSVIILTKPDLSKSGALVKKIYSSIGVLDQTGIKIEGIDSKISSIKRYADGYIDIQLDIALRNSAPYDTSLDNVRLIFFDKHMQKVDERMVPVHKVLQPDEVVELSEVNDNLPRTTTYISVDFGGWTERFIRDITIKKIF